MFRKQLHSLISAGDLHLVVGPDRQQTRVLLDLVVAELADTTIRTVRATAPDQGELGPAALIAQVAGQPLAPGPEGQTVTDEAVRRSCHALSVLEGGHDHVLLVIEGAQALQPGAWQFIDHACAIAPTLRLALAVPEASWAALHHAGFAVLRQRPATPLHVSGPAVDARICLASALLAIPGTFDVPAPYDPAKPLVPVPLAPELLVPRPFRRSSIRQRSIAVLVVLGVAAAGGSGVLLFQDAPVRASGWQEGPGGSANEAATLASPAVAANEAVPLPEDRPAASQTAPAVSSRLPPSAAAELAAGMEPPLSQPAAAASDIPASIHPADPAQTPALVAQNVASPAPASPPEPLPPAAVTASEVSSLADTPQPVLARVEPEAAPALPAMAAADPPAPAALTAGPDQAPAASTSDAAAPATQPALTATDPAVPTAPRAAPEQEPAASIPEAPAPVPVPLVAAADRPTPASPSAPEQGPAASIPDAAAPATQPALAAADGPASAALPTAPDQAPAATIPDVPVAVILPPLPAVPGNAVPQTVPEDVAPLAAAPMLGAAAAPETPAAPESVAAPAASSATPDRPAPAAAEAATSAVPAPAVVAVPGPVAVEAPAVPVAPPDLPRLPVPAPSPRATSPAMPSKMVAMLLSRADAMLKQGDVSAARVLYDRAAAAGSGAAATGMGRTFDAGFLAQIGVMGVRADPSQAAVWYRRGAELGDDEAQTRLRGLNAAAVPQQAVLEKRQ